MHFSFWTIGKTSSGEIQRWEEDFHKRIRSFTQFSSETIDAVKTFRDPEHLKQEEAKKVLSKLKPEDFLILLDEKGKTFTSRAFATYIEKMMINGSSRRVIFLVGGAYGFHISLYERANDQISLSSMTFSHQLIRPVFLEQLYRAFTIINRHPYHND